MKYIKYILLIFIIGTLLSVNIQATHNINDDEEDNDKTFLDETTEIIIKINKEFFPEHNGMKTSSTATEIETIRKINEKHKARSMTTLLPDNNKKTKTSNELSHYYTVSFDKTIDVEEIIKDYQQLDEIAYAEPNYRYHIMETFPNDPRFTDQWGLHQGNDCDIDAPEAWDIETGEDDVIIAIHDTGVDYTHPDLSDHIWINEDEIPGNGIDDDGNGYIDDVNGWDFVSVDPTWVYPGEDPGPRDNDPMDFHSHGTHCAGIACAVTNNGVGVTGVCWDCTIMPIRVGYHASTGGGLLETDDIVPGIIYAADNGAHVLSMSWGGGDYSQAIKDALAYAYAKGVILVNSAGNANSDVVNYPSAYPHVISVASTDDHDEKSSFSNYGNWVDIAAPGTGILSTVPVGSGRESFLTVEAISYESYPMKFSAYDDVTGELYDVGYGQTEDVEGLDLNGKIALIERGFISFKDKIVNVHSKGAIGAIVFNNQQGTFIGDLQEQQDIPAISINQTDGLFLRNLVSSQTSTAHLQVAISDYEQKDGTSMSCPMVAGVIGLMLSNDPDLSQEEVLFILRSTADPLDSEFDLGAGRVNAYQALSYEPVYSKKAPVFSPLTLFALMIILSSVGLITLRKRS